MQDITITIDTELTEQTIFSTDLNQALKITVIPQDDIDQELAAAQKKVQDLTVLQVKKADNDAAIEAVALEISKISS